MTRKKNGRPSKLEGKRTKVIKARVSEQEYAQVSELWVSLGLKESDFLRVKLLNSSSVSIKVNASDVLQMLDGIGSEIGRSGNNINQLARHANFLHKRGMLSNEVTDKFNELFSTYISLFRDMEKLIRELLRLLKA